MDSPPKNSTQRHTENDALANDSPSSSSSNHAGKLQPRRSAPLLRATSRMETPGTSAQAEQQQSAAATPMMRPAMQPRLPSIRIQPFRAPTSTQWPRTQTQTQTQFLTRQAQTPLPTPTRNPQLDPIDETVATTGRRRSSSEPQRPSWVRVSGASRALSRLVSTPDPAPPLAQVNEEGVSEAPRRPLRPALARLRTAARSRFGLNQAFRKQVPSTKPEDEQPTNWNREYDDRFVDWLDLVDPEVSTLETLTNVQNSLFIPNLGQWINRRPTYTLMRPEPDSEKAKAAPVESRPPSRGSAEVRSEGAVAPVPGTPMPIDERPEEGEEEEAAGAGAGTRPPELGTIDSTMSESRFAVLPHGTTLEGWSTADKHELDDHVRHMLHSRRSRFRRRLRGFGQYVSRPLGFLVTVYATLITLSGLAWVLFLIGWINVGGKQLYVINVIDNVLVALFAIMGDGLAPFRAVDTYHMLFIARYHRRTMRLRRKLALPKLQDRNDLPPTRTEQEEAESAWKASESSVLSPTQQKRLQHHQERFAKSHTFYKPHETTTHRAFPLRLLVAVVVLLDFHSLFQIALGSCTWAIPYRKRPFALTTVILCCSICCNITAGVLITIGDRKTRKKDVLERMTRQELTQEAIGKVEKKRMKRGQEGGVQRPSEDNEKRNSQHDKGVKSKMSPEGT